MIPEDFQLLTVIACIGVILFLVIRRVIERVDEDESS